MAFSVEVKVNTRFQAACSSDTAYRLLSDVPESVSHFPKVAQLVDLGANTYRWEMEKIGLDRYFIQTVYACRYTSNKKKGTVVWESVDGVGNAVVEGQWTIKALDDGGSQCRLSTTAVLTIPLPSLLRFLLSGLVESEFQSLIQEYTANLKKTLNHTTGGAGRTTKKK